MDITPLSGAGRPKVDISFDSPPEALFFAGSMSGLRHPVAVAVLTVAALQSVETGNRLQVRLPENSLRGGR